MRVLIPARYVGGASHYQYLYESLISFLFFIFFSFLCFFFPIDLRLSCVCVVIVTNVAISFLGGKRYS